MSVRFVIKRPTLVTNRAINTNIAGIFDASLPQYYWLWTVSHWTLSGVGARLKQGRLKDVFHFLILITDNSDVLRKAEEVVHVARYNEKFKVNVAFRFILKDKTKDE